MVLLHLAGEKNQSPGALITGSGVVSRDTCLDTYEDLFQRELLYLEVAQRAPKYKQSSQVTRFRHNGPLLTETKLLDVSRVASSAPRERL